jgi:hypothetical protein
MSLTALENAKRTADPKALSFLHQHLWGSRIPRARPSKKKVTTSRKPKIGPAVPFLVRKRHSNK